MLSELEKSLKEEKVVLAQEGDYTAKLLPITMVESGTELIPLDVAKDDFHGYAMNVIISNGEREALLQSSAERDHDKPLNLRYKGKTQATYESGKMSVPLKQLFEQVSPKL